jgi:hypothetical protein
MENPFKWENKSKGLPFTYNPVTEDERKKSQWKEGDTKILKLYDFNKELKNERLRRLPSKNAAIIVDDYEFYVDKPKGDINYDDYWLKLEEVKALKKLNPSEDMTLEEYLEQKRKKEELKKIGLRKNAPVFVPSFKLKSKSKSVSRKSKSLSRKSKTLSRKSKRVSRKSKRVSRKSKRVSRKSNRV